MPPWSFCGHRAACRVAWEFLWGHRNVLVNIWARMCQDVHMDELRPTDHGGTARHDAVRLINN